MECELQHCQVLLWQMYQLYQCGKLTDVVLVVEGHRFSTHACILVAYSSFFNNMVLENGAAVMTEIVLENTTAAAVASLLEYFYTGELRLTRELVDSIQSLAEQLIIPEALSQCQLFNKTSAARSADEGNCLPEPSYKSQGSNAEGKSKMEKCDGREIDTQSITEAFDATSGKEVQPASGELATGQFFSLRKRKASKQMEEVREATPRAKKRKRMTTPRHNKNSECAKAPYHSAEAIRQKAKDDSSMRANLHSTLNAPKSKGERTKRQLVQDTRIQARSLRDAKSRVPNKMIEKVANGEVAGNTMYRCVQSNGKKLHSQSAAKRHLQSHGEVGHDLEVEMGMQKAGLARNLNKGGVKSQKLRRGKECSQAETSQTGKWNGLDVSVNGCIRKIGKSEYSGEVIYRCSECDGKELHGELAVRVHLQTHGDPKEESEIVRRCRHCGRAFGDLRSYGSHLYKHGLNKEDRTLEDTDPEKLPLFNSRLYGPTRNEVAHECQECGCMFTGLSDLKAHIKQRHPDVSYCCPHCLVVHFVKFTHERHIMLKHGTRHHICDICGQGFVRRTSVIRHKHCKHGIAEPSLEMFHCTEPGCSFIGYTPSMLSKHVKLHSSNTPSHVCETCGKTFSQKGALCTHIRVIHEKLRLYSCTRCSEKMTDKGALRNHMASSHGVKPLKCQDCSYCTHDSKQLRNHRYSLHGVKPEGEKVQVLQCDQCDYTCLDAARMRYHAAVHDTSSSFLCPHGECSKTFPSKRRLQNHISFQHGTKLFKCPYCPYTSPQSHKIKIHMRLVHTHVGYKPYQCPYCDFRCATGGNCRKHVIGRHPGQEVRYVKTGESLPDVLKNMKFKAPVAHGRVTDDARVYSLARENVTTQTAQV